MTTYESTTSRLLQQELGACALIQDLLPLYIEGEVSAASRDLIAEHLARCERCAGFLAGARTVRDQLGRETRLRQSSVAQDQSAHQAIVRGQRRLMAIVLGAFVGLCLLFVAVAAPFFLFRNTGPVAPGIPAPIATPIIQWNPELDAEEMFRHEEEMRRQAELDAARGMWQPPADVPIQQNPELIPTAPPLPTPSPAPLP
jgi:hypothetical protein